MGLVAFIALLISGCGGDEHKGQYCARSHDYTFEQPIYGYMKVGKISYPYVMYYIPETRTVCDEWLPKTPSTPSASSTS